MFKMIENVKQAFLHRKTRVINYVVLVLFLLMVTFSPNLSTKAGTAENKPYLETSSHLTTTGKGPGENTFASFLENSSRLEFRTLTVNLSGTGSGSVSGPGITCPTDCSETVFSHTTVELTATPGPESTFSGWSGACTGTGTCIVSMTEDKSVTATFTLNTYTLTVSTDGIGWGTVSGPGISCPEDCSETYPFGTLVTLTTSSDYGATLTGWSGACSGTEACTVTMTEDKSVTATFTYGPYILYLNLSDAGEIQSSTGHVCRWPSACGFPLYNYMSASLHAYPQTGYRFDGWGGDCIGHSVRDECYLRMTSDKHAYAYFSFGQYHLVVNIAGDGRGNVTGTGIDCPGDCLEDRDWGKSVLLTATPASGSTFTGWSGDASWCGQNPVCTVSMTYDFNVTATFDGPDLVHSVFLPLINN